MFVLADQDAVLLNSFLAAFIGSHVFSPDGTNGVGKARTCPKQSILAEDFTNSVFVSF